jgi:hypothetical protein
MCYSSTYALVIYMDHTRGEQSQGEGAQQPLAKPQTSSYIVLKRSVPKSDAG